jgi:signal transduction histidine kinase
MNYPSFVDNKTYFALDSGLSELEQATSLAENLKKIHLLTTKHYSAFTSLIDEYLQTGLEIFQMEVGIVSRIEGDDYFICEAISPGNVFASGDVFPLRDTYCYEVFRSNQVIGFPHVGLLVEMKSHPVYLNMRLESYLSAPIYKEGKLFGTLNFTSTQVRKNGFSEHERDLISLMANAIGSFLVLQDKEQDLIQSNTRLKELVGYVAHDLRGPMGSILTVAEMLHYLEDEEKDEVIQEIAKSTKKSLNMVYNILELAAMGTGKIELQRSKVCFKSEVEDALRQVQMLAHAKHLEIEANLEPFECMLDQERMGQVLINLLSNAIKYAPAHSTVRVALDVNGSGDAELSIENSLDATSLSAKDKTRRLEDSVGFGLEIVREVLGLHDSALRVNVTANAYSTSFVLHSSVSPVSTSGAQDAMQG